MADGWTGVWKFEPDTPEDKKCDLDRAAEVIVASGYKPKEISLEQLTERLVADAEEDFMRDEQDSLYGGTSKMFNMLSKEVFAEWLSLQNISDYDYKG